MPKLINKQNKNGVPNNPSTIPKKLNIYEDIYIF